MKKILSKILENQIQQHIKRIIYYDQVAFILGIEGWFNTCKWINVMHDINRMKYKKHTILSTDAEKNIWQNSTPFHNEVSTLSILLAHNNIFKNSNPFASLLLWKSTRKQTKKYIPSLIFHIEHFGMKMKMNPSMRLKIQATKSYKTNSKSWKLPSFF